VLGDLFLEGVRVFKGMVVFGYVDEIMIHWYIGGNLVVNIASINRAYVDQLVIE
jgi:hypothetical protein